MIVGVVCVCEQETAGAAAVVKLVPEDQRDVHVPGSQHAERLRRLRLGEPQVEAGVLVVQHGGRVGTMVPSADGNAASRSRPARSPAKTASSFSAASSAR